MEKRKFGNTDLMVSPITFGAWSIGGPAEMAGKQIGWAGVEDSTSIKALQTAYDIGINIFDTADSYANGHSEELIGKALSNKRDKIHISTKVGMVESGTSEFKLDFSRKHIFQACEGSLKRLKTDYIDIYMLHMTMGGYSLTDEMKETFEELIKQGKIRNYGVSLPGTEQGTEQIEKSFGNSMMIEYNILTDPKVEEVMKLACDKGIGIITRGSLSKGLLTGKYKVGHRFPNNDVRSRLPENYIDKVLGNVEKLKKYSLDRGYNLLSLAMAYQLEQIGCSTITVGLKNPNQVKEMVASISNMNKYNWTEIKQIMELEE